LKFFLLKKEIFYFFKSFLIEISAVAVIQYFMQVHHLPMQSAFRVTKLARSLKISPVFRETLEFLDSQLRSEGKLPPIEPSNRLAPRVHV
jgi:hypothetical protein